MIHNILNLLQKFNQAKFSLFFLVRAKIEAGIINAGMYSLLQLFCCCY